MSADPESDSDSDDSVGARAARERYQPGTQSDYNDVFRHMQEYVIENYQKGSPMYNCCMEKGVLKMPVDFSASKLFIRDTVQNRLLPWPDDNRSAERKTFQKHMSLSSMTTTISALKFSYKLKRQEMPSLVETDYNNIHAEYKLFVGNQRMFGDMPPVEGAAAINHSAYYLLMETAMLSFPVGRGRAESSIVNLWLFLCIAWNTLCRGERVGRIQLSFIRWFGDSMTISVPTSKSDAAGLMSYAKMCYANCIDFICCAVTALGIKVCSGLQDSQFLFGTSIGDAHYVVQRMRDALKELVSSLPKSADTVLQKSRALLTMHMPKKSGMRHLLGCGITGMHVPIHLRGDHKTGPYDLQSDADGVIGRVLANLSPFNLPPPHWHPAVISLVPFADFIPSFAAFPDEFRLAIPNIIASVVWHNVELSKRIPKSSPMHGSPLFTTHRHWMERLHPLLLGGTSGKSILSASGRNIMMEISDNVQILLQRELQLGSVSTHTLQFSAAQLLQIKEIVTAAVGVRPQLQQELSIAEQPRQMASQWANVMPLLYLNSEFRFPISIGLEDAYRRWFCAVPPLPPLHLITSKMIPSCESKQHRKAQKSLRSKFAGVMQVIHGLTSSEVCKRNVAYTWSVLWPRVVTLYSIQIPCSWTIATAFEKFHADKAKLAIAISFPALSALEVPESTLALPFFLDDALQRVSAIVAPSKDIAVNSKRGRSASRGSSIVEPGNPAPPQLRQNVSPSPMIDGRQLPEEPLPAAAACEPSVLPHVLPHEDWSEQMYVDAGKEVRFKCPYPDCGKLYETTTGIRLHWNKVHPTPVPEITQARTRVRVDASASVVATRVAVAAIATEREVAGRRWREAQDLYAAAASAGTVQLAAAAAAGNVQPAAAAISTGPLRVSLVTRSMLHRQ